MSDFVDTHDGSRDQSEVLNGRRPAADMRLMQDIVNATPVCDDDVCQGGVENKCMPEVTTSAMRTARIVEI